MRTDPKREQGFTPFDQSEFPHQTTQAPHARADGPPTVATAGPAALMRGVCSSSVSYTIRLRIDPRGIPPVKAARRLGLTEAHFERLKDKYFAIGFPRPDPISGNYDIRAIDHWFDIRSGLSNGSSARDASEVFQTRLEAFRGGKPR